MILAKNILVLLRPLKEEDLSDFLAYRSDPIVCRYQGFDPYTEKKALQFLKEHNWVDLQRKGEWMQMGIVDVSTNQLIGDAALRFLANEPRIAEIGCTLNRNFQGKGFAKAAITLLLKKVFDQTDAHKITALMDERNIAAIRLVEQLGFQREGHFRKSYFDKIDDGWMGEYQYGLLREDFYLTK